MDRTIESIGTYALVGNANRLSDNRAQHLSRQSVMPASERPRDCQHSSELPAISLAGSGALRRLLLGSRREGFAAALAAFSLGIHLASALRAAQGFQLLYEGTVGAGSHRGGAS